jgi:hypothetical protein
MSTIGIDPVMKENKILGRERYEVESDLRVLKDVKKIKGDPTRMASVKSLMHEELESLKNIADEKSFSDDDNHKMEY